MQKAFIEQVVASLPETFDLDLLIERLLLLESIQQPEDSLAEGRGIHHEEAKRQILSWRKQLGGGS